MTMTVGELMARLEDFNEEAEVRMMCQPGWPFEYSIRGICRSSDLEGSEEDRHPSTGINPKPEVVFLVEGEQLSYGCKDAWQAT